MLESSPANPTSRPFQRPQRQEPVGKILWAEITPFGPWGSRPAKPNTTAQAAGLRYERKAQSHFMNLFPGLYGGAQWISFREAHAPYRMRWAQPDGVLLNYHSNLITIFEMKIRHTEAAWWALRYLYEPLFTFLFPSWRIASCEVVRWFDPAVPWPEEYRRLPDPSLLRAGEIGVHIWKPR